MRSNHTSKKLSSGHLTIVNFSHSSRVKNSSMSALPTLSVIIPTYNRKILLREALKSLTRQTYPHDRIEVIVVDDGSTDGTAGIAAEAFSFSLRYFSESNQGDAAARNLGARQRQADILVFLV